LPLNLRPTPLQLQGAYSHRHSVTGRVRALLKRIQVRLAASAKVLMTGLIQRH